MLLQQEPLSVWACMTPGFAFFFFFSFVFMHTISKTNLYIHLRQRRQLYPIICPFTLKLNLIQPQHQLITQIYFSEKFSHISTT